LDLSFRARALRKSEEVHRNIKGNALLQEKDLCSSSLAAASALPSGNAETVECLVGLAHR
jgi:hypothetical protein